MQDAITAVAGADKNSHHPMLQQREVKKSGYLVITSDSLQVHITQMYSSTSER